MANSFSGLTCSALTRREPRRGGWRQEKSNYSLKYLSAGNKDLGINLLARRGKIPEQTQAAIKTKSLKLNEKETFTVKKQPAFTTTSVFGTTSRGLACPRHLTKLWPVRFAGAAFKPSLNKAFYGLKPVSGESEKQNTAVVRSATWKPLLLNT